jgi:hypothetical protein
MDRMPGFGSYRLPIAVQTEVRRAVFEGKGRFADQVRWIGRG